MSSKTTLPALPADAWAAIARATLRAEGDRAWAWERLSRINSTWRAGLRGDWISWAMTTARVLLTVRGPARRARSEQPAKALQSEAAWGPCTVHQLKGA